DLEIDTFPNELQGAAAIIGSCQHRSERELAFDAFNDRAGCVGIVDAHQYRFGVVCAGCVEDIEPGAVAIIDLEAESRRGADHFDVIVDDRYVDAAQEQRLADDLSETAKADDEHATLKSFCD